MEHCVRIYFTSTVERFILPGLKDFQRIVLVLTPLLYFCRCLRFPKIHTWGFQVKAEHSCVSYELGNVRILTDPACSNDIWSGDWWYRNGPPSNESTKSVVAAIASSKQRWTQSGSSFFGVRSTFASVDCQPLFTAVSQRAQNIFAPNASGLFRHAISTRTSF